MSIPLKKKEDHSLLHLYSLNFVQLVLLYLQFLSEGLPPLLSKVDLSVRKKSAAFQTYNEDDTKRR